jgi:threonine dehydratase
VLSIADVRAAARRIRGVTHLTPVLTSRTLDAMTGATVFLKAECFQRGGSFKLRGAYNRVATLEPEARARGVVAFSSGNHAQAVAIAAGLWGTTAVIVMPKDAPRVKLEATRGYGAEIVTYDRHAQDREEVAAAVASERGLTLVRPYDDLFVMAGQGTAALELVASAGALDMLIVPVGGGGLIAGSATAAKGLLPKVHVIGVEPQAGDDTRRSIERGERVRIPVPRTIADGLQAQTPGELTFQVNLRLVDAVVTVGDDEIVRAMAFLYDRMKIAVEPSGAVGVAALLGRHVDMAGRRVGVIVSGGNTGAALFAKLISNR